MARATSQAGSRAAAAATATGRAAAARPGSRSARPSSRQPAQAVPPGSTSGPTTPVPSTTPAYRWGVPEAIQSSAAGRVGRVGRQPVPWGDDHQREAGLAAGRCRRRLGRARRAVRARPAAPAAGRPRPAAHRPPRPAARRAPRPMARHIRRPAPRPGPPRRPTAPRRPPHPPGPRPAPGRASPAGPPGAASRRPVPDAITDSDARSGRSRSSAPARFRNASAAGPPRRRVVQQSGRRQPLHQRVHLSVRQAHRPCLLAQQRQPARAVEQLEQAARRRVHRAEHHRVRGCHPELHGVADPASRAAARASPSDAYPPPSPIPRRVVRSRPAPPICCQHARPRRRAVESYPQAAGISRSNGARHGVDQARTVPEAGLPPLAAGNVGACPPTLPLAAPGRPTAQRGATTQREPPDPRLGDERGRGPQERPAQQNGLRLPRGRPHRRAHPRPDVRGGGAALGQRHARQARRPGEQADPRRRANWPSAPSGCPTSTSTAGPGPTSVRWVTNQNTRWGSCTPAEGSIRLSHRLQGMPEYVVDYVLAPRAGASARARPRPALLAAAGGVSAHRAGPRLPRGRGRRRPAAASARRPRRVTGATRSCTGCCTGLAQCRRQPLAWRDAFTYRDGGRSLRMAREFQRGHKAKISDLTRGHGSVRRRADRRPRADLRHQLLRSRRRRTALGRPVLHLLQPAEVARGVHPAARARRPATPSPSGSRSTASRRSIQQALLHRDHRRRRPDVAGRPRLHPDRRGRRGGGPVRLQRLGVHHRARRDAGRLLPQGRLAVRRRRPGLRRRPRRAAEELRRRGRRGGARAAAAAAGAPRPAFAPPAAGDRAARRSAPRAGAAARPQAPQPAARLRRPGRPAAGARPSAAARRCTPRPTIAAPLHPARRHRRRRRRRPGAPYGQQPPPAAAARPGPAASPAAAPGQVPPQAPPRRTASQAPSPLRAAAPHGSRRRPQPRPRASRRAGAGLQAALQPVPRDAHRPALDAAEPAARSGSTSAIGGQPVLARQGSMVLYQGKVDFSYKGAGFARPDRRQRHRPGDAADALHRPGPGLPRRERRRICTPSSCRATAICVSAENVLAFDESPAARGPPDRGPRHPRRRAVHHAVPGHRHGRRQDPRHARGPAGHARPPSPTATPSSPGRPPPR